MTKPKTKLTRVKNLKVGDEILSSSGRSFIVSIVKETNNKIIVILDEDMEIDFRGYDEVQVIQKTK